MHSKIVSIAIALLLLWSRREEESGLFQRGWQMRGGLLYDDLVSLNLLWSVLPYERGGPKPESGNMHSLHGGVMLHEKPGAITSSLLVAVLAGISVWIIAKGSPISVSIVPQSLWE